MFPSFLFDLIDLPGKFIANEFTQDVRIAFVVFAVPIEIVLRSCVRMW